MRAIVETFDMLGWNLLYIRREEDAKISKLPKQFNGKYQGLYISILSIMTPFLLGYRGYGMDTSGYGGVGQIYMRFWSLLDDFDPCFKFYH